MLFPDLPPQQQERVICAIAAAVKYEIPANIELAVAEQEAGHPGQWVANKNGSYDVGSMQFNTGYLRELAQYGIRPSDVATTGCYSFDLAAWRLRRHLRNDPGDIWTRVANYHSRTPIFNAQYRSALMPRAERWARWLEAHFVTYDVTPRVRDMPTATPAAISHAVVLKQASAQQAERPARPYVPRALIAAQDPR